MKASDLIKEMEKRDSIENIEVEARELELESPGPKLRGPYARSPVNDKITIRGEIMSDEGVMIEVAIKGRQKELDRKLDEVEF